MIGERAYRFGPAIFSAGVEFRLFAPALESAVVRYGSARLERSHRLASVGGGWLAGFAPDAGPGTRYAFAVGEDAFLVPDPASRRQPDGVHGASEVLAPTPRPSALARPIPAAELVIYELHVGAFSPEGTFAGVERKLDALCELGITAIELMPLAEAPGRWNWGYDGVLPFAPRAGYGEPEDLKRLIGAAHARGIAMILDVVYNHFGPEGNYLGRYAPQFFSARYETPWGAALDFESSTSEPVRAFFLENARYWIDEFGFDGFRLDATQTIFDRSEPPILVELSQHVRDVAPAPVHLIAENDLNLPDLVERGFTAQWNDDVHHALHVLLTGEADGYYGDFAGDPVGLLGRALATGFAFQGESSRFRGDRPRGAPSAHLPATAFVNFVANHDQVGNRPSGERLSHLAPAQALRAALAVVLLAPGIPMVFMGDEWAASSPFLYFCDFEPRLAQAVRVGRAREHASFSGRAIGAFPDPTSVDSFRDSVLRWSERGEPEHERWVALHRELLAVRRREIVPRLAGTRGEDGDYARIGERGLVVRRRLGDGSTLALETNLGPREAAGFASDRRGRTIFTTPEPIAAGVFPPWSVRWSIV